MNSHEELAICTISKDAMTVPVRIKNENNFIEQDPYDLKNILTALKTKQESPVTKVKVKELVLDTTNPCSLNPQEIIDWQIQAVELGCHISGDLFTDETLEQAKKLITAKKAQQTEEKVQRAQNNFISANLFIGGLTNLTVDLINPCANPVNAGVSLFASFAVSASLALSTESVQNSRSIIKKILVALTPTATVFVPKIAAQYVVRTCAPAVPYVAAPLLMAGGAAWYFRSGLKRASENCYRLFKPRSGDIEAPFINEPRTRMPRSP